MSNAWKHPQLIANEVLMHLEDALTVTALTARDLTQEYNHTPNGYAKGDTLTFKMRPDYVTNDFDQSTGTVPQDIVESTRQMTIEKHFDITVQVKAKEKILDLDSFSEQVIKPAAYRLAESCDKYTAGKILQGRGMYSSSALFGTRADMAQARKTATLQQLSPTGRFCLMDLDLEAQLLGADWFTVAEQRGEPGVLAQTTGHLGHTLGMDFFSSINFVNDTRTSSSGTCSTSATATDNPLAATVLKVGTITGGFTAGDRIKIAGVRRPLVVKTTIAAGSGPLSIALVDPIDEIIPVSAAVTVVGAGQANTIKGAIFDDRSLAIASPMLDPAEDKPSFVVSNNGISIRVVQGYDMKYKMSTLSMDMLLGGFAFDPRRITLLADY